jgi:hypothetical protein
MKHHNGLKVGQKYEVVDVNTDCYQVRCSDGDLCWKYQFRFEQVKTKGKGSKAMEEIKKYFNEHKDTFITIAVVALLDEFLLGGGLRKRIQSMCESILNRAEKTLGGGDSDD